METNILHGAGSQAMAKVINAFGAQFQDHLMLAESFILL